MVRQFHEALGNTNVIVRGVNPGPMRTGFRAKIYHAENPLDQPEPTLAAEKITAMLSGHVSAEEPIINL
jgi:short-subunit dehydrogenase